jgi:hypothetical protein
MIPIYKNRFVREFDRRAKENEKLFGINGYFPDDMIKHARRYGINMNDETFEPESFPTGFTFTDEITMDDGHKEYVGISMETDQIFVKVLESDHSTEILKKFSIMFDQEPDVFFRDEGDDVCAWFYGCDETEIEYKIGQLLNDNPIKIKKWKGIN